MAGYLPPGSPFFPAPPTRSTWSRPLPQTYWQFSPRPRDNTTSPGAMIGVAICVGAFLLVLIFLCRYHNSRANDAAHAAAAAAALAARPPAPPQPAYWDNNEEQWLCHHRSDDRDDDGRTRRASPTAELPSFAYNRAVRHNVTGTSGGDEAATCSVCLGVFQVGETVRLLPVCLHLYHVECIDPWLEAHSTCPLCRAGTDDDPTMHGVLLPPV
ncbi:RING-H2 finger protein ATL43-like [Miscanthus floridulus]|uniref:RING-H2 finger protein ATL43-like n=1 Tax=Miscanthus floridulus TaxID=154761 RepID=UPI00345AF212